MNQDDKNLGKYTEDEILYLMEWATQNELNFRVYDKESRREIFKSYIREKSETEIK